MGFDSTMRTRAARRRLGATTVAVAVVLAAAPLTARADEAVSVTFDPTPVPPSTPALVAGDPAPCGEGSWLAGSVEICDGEVVYRDYVYDAHGASSYPAPHPAFRYDPFSFPAGFAYGAYPPGGSQTSNRPDDEANLGDIVALRIRRADSGGGLDLSMELNTLTDPASTRAIVLVDRTLSGPSRAVPGLVANPVTRTAPRATGWDDLVELTCDAGTNLCTGALAGPVDGPVRLWALTARASDDVVLNVAFRGVDETGFWWDGRQSGALHAGDITTFRHTINPADLDPGTTQRAVTPAGRALQRVYVSDHPLGEGVSSDGVPGPASAPGPQGDFGGQAFTMLGRHQPYGFYVPASGPNTPTPHGVQLVMHGLSENHSARIVNTSAGWRPNGFTTTFGDGQNRILVAPLGRGWRGWYSGHSERDVLDALGDAMANYPVDPDRVFVSGLSMGGFGTLWLGAMHPHLWAGALNWVGWTGDMSNGYPFADQYDGAQWGSRVGAIANALDLVGNLRHVPSAHVYGAADQLVHVTQATALRDTLAEHLVPSAFWLHPTGDHLGSVVADHWAKEAEYSAGRTRVRDPRTVTFRTDERFFFPELGIVPDHAYWVRNIRPAGAGFADVQATSDGCGSTDPTHSVTTGVGPFDPPPLLASLSQHVGPTGEEGGVAAQEVTVRTTNVAALAVETGDGASGACLGAGPVTLRLSTDGPLELRLDDGRTVTVAAAGDHEVTVPSVADLRDDGDNGDGKKGGRPATNPGKGPGGSGPPGGPGAPGGDNANGAEPLAGAPVSSTSPLAAGLLPAVLAAALAAAAALTVADRRRRRPATIDQPTG